MDWNGVRVLVTGADGFMGSHLTEALLNKGAEVSIYVRGTTETTVKYKLKNIQHLENKLKAVLTGNIGNTDAIKLIENNNPQIIFHLAADAYVPNSFEHPLEVMETNVIGTLNVLHAAMHIKELQQVVCTSSSEIYGSAVYVPIDEKHPLNPTSPYAASKVAADRYCFAYWNTYKLPIAVIRPFNTYGPRHTYDVIPKFISLALENKDLTVYGSGDQSRDFTYVDDMVRAFMVMGSEKKAVGEAVNFGTSKDISINDVAGRIISISNSKSRIVHQKERLAEVTRLCCDYGKAEKLFGWKPTVDIDEGLRRNIEWQRNH
ncbi:MAG: GDP-mannose 4,6-dehydratase [Candidatus Aenigmarchaeota archaeon]|nr:GDP-mannose 4,6-dehydratase [Candidatus Aenigmarchaeota archaeon]